MKLLITTQAVDESNPILGFFVSWIKEFAKHCELVTVICLYQGIYNLPTNVKVLSLGKENGESRIKYIYRFYKYIWQEKNNYEAVFVHMNKIYVVLGGTLWKLRHKKIGFWYVHKQVDWQLRLAEKLVNIIFTASEKSFRLRSKKVKTVGHGIDTDRFKPSSETITGGTFKIISIGRIAEVKNYELLISAVGLLQKEKLDKKIEVNIIGAPQTLDEAAYLNKLKRMVADAKLEGEFFFPGAIVNKEVVEQLQSADLFVNMSRTGSLDKAVLEAMACETLVITANEAFFEILGNLSKNLIVNNDNPVELAEKIRFFMSVCDQAEKQKIEESLRKIVIDNHNLSNLVSKIIKVYDGSAS